MANEINEISQRLKGLREACGYSIEALCNELGFDVAQYTAYEEVGDDIPISVVYAVANKFGVDFAEIITGKAARLDTYHIVKKGTGEEIKRYPGYHFEDLAQRYSHKLMQPLLVTLEPTDEPAELVCHSGQEFNMVLEGKVAVTFDDKEFILSEGDCIYFNPTHPHGQRCASETTAKFLTVIAE